ncbi:ABC transporter permease [Granulicella aggregans]|uniref:ABC transporter permease n=1 Tax=Granulicella aggregans TaxID=474949 RepID=UPI0021E0AE3B|nr:ABC transporter permease [Granulicella aggregans]
MIATVRQALRSLRKSPAFALTVIATLGIGIGLNAAIFAVVDCVLLRPLGYHDADRIVALRTRFVSENRSYGGLGGGDYVDISKQVHGLESTAFYQSWADGLSLNGKSVYLQMAVVSPRFAEVMGVQPVAGRLFNPEEKDGRDILVSEGFAQEYFGSSQAALGKSASYGTQIYTIVGVLPGAFSFPDKTRVWIEQKQVPENLNRTAYNQEGVGKRRADVSPEQLAAEFATFSAHLQKAYVEDAHKALESVPLQEQMVGWMRSRLRLLMGAVGVILVIICANITHLQLVRATRELRSVTIRTALGASRSTLAGRALLEAAILSLAGSLAAVLVAAPALKLLVSLAPTSMPRLEEIHLNADVFVFSFLISFAVMAITALLPVWRSWHIDPSTAMRADAARGTETHGSLRLRDGLIVAEVALTLTLSVAAILLAQKLIVDSKQDLGFNAQSLVTLDMHVVGSPSLPEAAKDKSPAALAEFQERRLAVTHERMNRLDDVLRLISGTPGVTSASAMDGAPMRGVGNVSYAIKGRQVFAPGVENLPVANLSPVTPSTFATLGVPLLRGRWLNANDRIESPKVLLIDSTLAQAVFHGQDPIGQQIMCGYDSEGEWWTIVGVVGGIRARAPGVPPTPTIYVPVAQHPSIATDMQLVVRTALDPAAMGRTLQEKLMAVHPELAIKVSTMQEALGGSQQGERFESLLFGSFAGVSVLLAAVGMYGVTAYSVAQRRFEFGLRVALGADRPQLFGMVLRKAMVFATAGVVLGIGLSLGLMRVLASVIGRLPKFDPVVYGLASVAVLVVALLAMFLPARSAAKVDPMSVLRSE